MKEKIITLLLLVLMISPTINAQTKKDLKKLEKFKSGLKITVKDIDFTEKFVIHCDVKTLSNIQNEYDEEEWKEIFFENGLNIGDYYYKEVVKDARNREMSLESKMIVRARYLFTKSTNFKFIITDIKKNNEVVAIISVKSKPTFKDSNMSWRSYIIQELIKKVNAL